MPDSTSQNTDKEEVTIVVGDGNHGSSDFIGTKVAVYLDNGWKCSGPIQWAAPGSDGSQGTYFQSMYRRGFLK